MGIFKCFFGHQEEELGGRFIIEGKFGQTFVKYGAYCPRCGKFWLENSRTAESWHPIEAISESEALAVLEEKFKKLTPHP